METNIVLEKTKAIWPVVYAVGQLVWPGSETKNFAIQQSQFSEF